MKKLIGVVAAASMTLGVAGTASAEKPNRADAKNAAKYCKELRTSSGSPEAFAEAVKAVVGAKKVTTKNAYGKCVSAQKKNNAEDREDAKSNAAKDCRAEQKQSDDEFGSTHGGKTFQEFYGTGKNGKNAFGKCVSSKARENKQEAAEENEEELNAAKECKAERKQSDDEFGSTHGGKTFTEFYGTNRNGKNAFGKCVSSKSQEDDEGSTS